MDHTCPFCKHDPYEYVDIGVGMQPVAVTCCNLGIALFDHRGAETVTLDREEFVSVATTISRLTAERDAAERALKSAGYTKIDGAAEWKPPLGPSASPLLDELDRLRKALEKIRDDHYPPSDLELRDCEQPEMVWQSVARRALAAPTVTDAERGGDQ